MKGLQLKRCVAIVTVLLLALGLLAGCGDGATNAGGDNQAPAADGAAPAGNSGGSGGESIKLGYVGPLTGPMAHFTVGIRYTAEKALGIMNEDGGIYIAELDKKVPVEIVWGDSESSPTTASEVATRLATVDKVDILIGEWTPDTINPVSVVGERNKIPTVLANSPAESWLEAGPYEWSFGILFLYDTHVEEYFNGWDKMDTNKKIGLVTDNNVDGVYMAELVANKAAERGYTLVDPGRFPQGTMDYSAIITEIMNEDCDILLASMLTPELVTLWNQCQQLGYKPKTAILSKGMHFSSDLLTLGEGLGENVCIETQWSADFPFTSSLTGQTAAELSAEFEEVIGESPDVTLGWDWAIFDVIHDVLTRAESLDKEVIRQAFADTDLDCIYGNIKFRDDNVGVVPVVFGQWLPDDTWGYRKVIVAAGNFPEIPTVDELLPLPWYEG